MVTNAGKVNPPAPHAAFHSPRNAGDVHLIFTETRGAVAVTDGWEESASAWIASMGERGDFSRRHILDKPMLARVDQSGATAALDLGCGEGRFSRLLAARGIATVGIDPSPSLIAEARRRHPDGDYRVAGAEVMPLADGSVDLVVAYLSLIDIPDLAASIAEAERVLQPGGRLLIANLTSFFSAGNPSGWRTDTDGGSHFIIDHYMDERSDWVGWSGIRIRNWHRPMSTYMTLLLDAGLRLTHFDEPLPDPAFPDQVALFKRVPSFVVMEWEKARG
ncbi:SAM-dependent methyltransferase [Nostoc sp. 3335mG]|nr:SAM-dependent methyltransferase [Nostoc sp. 3335mG]